MEPAASSSLAAAARISPTVIGAAASDDAVLSGLGASCSDESASCGGCAFFFVKLRRERPALDAAGGGVLFCSGGAVFFIKLRRERPPVLALGFCNGSGCRIILDTCCGDSSNFLKPSVRSMSACIASARIASSRRSAFISSGRAASASRCARSFLPSTRSMSAEACSWRLRRSSSVSRIVSKSAAFFCGTGSDQARCRSASRAASSCCSLVEPEGPISSGSLSLSL
mmetsp:Transcript_73439/g.119182  ORF Transcript_73439/g.119182 Transcript_73439/m.119182 type:complete len:227 (-) Transcript_73439:223-903(-)